jgi:hypothetical protein
MTAYLPEIAKVFDSTSRRGYSSSRHSFRPRAYAVLTRADADGSEESHG